MSEPEWETPPPGEAARKPPSSCHLPNGYPSSEDGDTQPGTSNQTADDPLALYRAGGAIPRSNGLIINGSSSNNPGLVNGPTQHSIGGQSQSPSGSHSRHSSGERDRKKTKSWEAPESSGGNPDCRRRPRVCSDSDGLSYDMWHQLESEGFLPHGYCNGVLPHAEPQDDMEAYFNAQAGQVLSLDPDTRLGEAELDRRPAAEDSPLPGSPVENGLSPLVAGTTRLSSSSEDLGDFIETDISLTPKFGTSSCGNSCASSLEDVRHSDVHDEGVDISAANVGLSTWVRDHHEHWRHMAQQQASLSCCDGSQCTSCTKLLAARSNNGEYTVAPCEPPEEAFILAPTSPGPSSSSSGSVDHLRSDGPREATTSESSSYFSPDVDIEFIDLDIDCPGPASTDSLSKEDSDSGDVDLPAPASTSTDDQDSQPDPPQSAGWCEVLPGSSSSHCHSETHSRSNLGTLSCEQVSFSCDGYNCRHHGCPESQSSSRRASLGSPSSEDSDVFTEGPSPDPRFPRRSVHSPQCQSSANDLDLDCTAKLSSDVKLFNVSRQTSTSNFDQDENSFQEDEVLPYKSCNCDHNPSLHHRELPRPKPLTRCANNNYKELPGAHSRLVDEVPGCSNDNLLNERLDPDVCSGRQTANTRASTWPRATDGESPLTALKLLDYEFSDEGSSPLGMEPGRPGSFALSDDDSPINAARLLESSLAAEALKRFAAESQNTDEDRPRSRSGKGRTSRDRTQLLLSLLRMMSERPPKPPSNGEGSSVDSEDSGRAMIWSEYDAYVLQVKQIGTSACGATAVINVLKAFELYADKCKVCDIIQTNLRAENAAVPEYLQSRALAGTTADCLIAGIRELTGGAIEGRFFHFYPPRDVNLHSWLAQWIRRGAVPLLTLNLQQGVTSGEIPDAWHHQMCYGVSQQGAFLTNPLQVAPFHLLMSQLTSESVLRIRRQDIIRRWTPHTNLSTLFALKDPRWMQMNVLGQIVNVLREASMPRVGCSRPQLTSHVTIPAWYRAGITLFVKAESEAHAALKQEPELPLGKNNKDSER